MNKRILIIFASSPNSVRLSKEASFLKTKGFSLSYIGWCRSAKKFAPDNRFEQMTTLLTGGGTSTKTLPLKYFCYIIRLVFHLLFKRDLKKYTIFAINFESAYAVWFVSHFRKVNYIYDIWDEFAISHGFPKWVIRVLRRLDKKIRNKASFYIHVDANRVSEIDGDNYVIIYNSPLDYYEGKKIEKNYKNSFAVTGWLNETRGLQSIFEFAKDNPSIRFIVAGGFRQNEFRDKFLSLPNIEYHVFMPQRELFNLINDCRGIFSLYDTKIPINKLAASNKLYDAMMLGIPIIVNKDLEVACNVEKQQLGYVVDYEYNSSWNQLSVFNVDKIRLYGQCGRNLYLENYEFSAMMESVFIPAYEKYIQ